MAGFGKITPVNRVGYKGSNAITYDDLQVSISLGRVPAANAPTWTDITIDGFTFKGLAFDIDDYLDLFIQTNHSTKLNTLIENHIHWTIAVDENGDEIAFEITGIGGGIGDAMTSIGTITSSDLVLASNAGKHNYLQLGDIPSLNTTVSSVFVVRLKRVAVASGTDASGAIHVFFNDCHVKLNTFGSIYEDQKG